MRTLGDWVSGILCLSVVALVAISVLHNRPSEGSGSVQPNASTTEIMSQAETLNNQGKHGEALGLLFKAYNKEPENAALKTLLQKTFAQYFQTQVTSGYARVAQDKHDVEAYVTIANAYKLNHQFLEAMVALDDGVLENPNSVLLWLNIGLLELMRGKDAEALSVYKEALRLDEKNPIALNNVAYVESRSDDERLIDLKEARELAVKAVAAEPLNANFLETLALIEFKRGEKEEAKRLIKQAISIDPNDSLYQSDLEIIQK